MDPASEKDPEGFNATELSAYCRERGLYPEVGGFYWTVLAPVIVNSEREEQGLVSV